MKILAKFTAVVICATMLTASCALLPAAEKVPSISYKRDAITLVVVDETEVVCLAENIYHEGRGQPRFGQLAIGLTTLSRSKDYRWPKTICGVVYEPHQFSWVTQIPAKHNHTDVASYQYALVLSRQILSGYYDNLLPLFAPKFFHSTSVKPDWSRRMNNSVIIKDHIFYE